MENLTLDFPFFESVAMEPKASGTSPGRPESSYRSWLHTDELKTVFLSVLCLKSRGENDVNACRRSERWPPRPRTVMGGCGGISAAIELKIHK